MLRAVRMNCNKHAKQKQPAERRSNMSVTLSINISLIHIKHFMFFYFSNNETVMEFHVLVVMISVQNVRPSVAIIAGPSQEYQ